MTASCVLQETVGVGIIIIFLSIIYWDFVFEEVGKFFFHFIYIVGVLGSISIRTLGRQGWWELGNQIQNQTPLLEDQAIMTI